MLTSSFHPIPPPTTQATPDAAVVDYHDGLLIEAITTQEDQPVALWSVIHEIVAAERPAGRTQRRELVGCLLSRMRSLLSRGVLVRDDKRNVRLAPPPKKPLPPPSKPLQNLPPAPDPSVADWFTFEVGGPSRRVFRV